MFLRRALFSFFAGLAPASCAPVAAPADPPPSNEGHVMITLQRGVCYGFCPDYTVTISGEGQVTYTGRRFVNVVGEQRATIAAADVQRLLRRFDAANFDGLRDSYRAQVTDLPTFTVTLERNGRRKVVVDYGGTSAGMPQAVRDLQDEIDRVANTARWVLRDGQPVRDRPQP
jgi:hypothetical protein